MKDDVVGRRHCRPVEANGERCPKARTERKAPLPFELDPDGNAPKLQRQHVRGVWREYWVWPHPKHYIWGATAAILVRLAELLREKPV